MAVSFIGGRSLSPRRKPPTFRNSLTITLYRVHFAMSWIWTHNFSVDRNWLHRYTLQFIAWLLYLECNSNIKSLKTNNAHTSKKVSSVWMLLSAEKSINQLINQLFCHIRLWSNHTAYKTKTTKKKHKKTKQNKTIQTKTKTKNKH